jgi:hypothetical protein
VSRHAALPHSNCSTASKGPSTQAISGRARWTVRGIANPPLLTSDSEGSTLLPSASYRDLMVLKGGGRGPTKLGVVPLSDGAGAVAAIGEGVTRVKIGDRSAGCFHPRWFGGPLSADYLTDRLGANLDGMLAESYPGDWVTRLIRRRGERQFYDLDAILEFDALDDFRQLVFAL